MPLRSLNAYLSPSLLIVHDSARPATICVLSSGKVTSVSTMRRPTRLELRSVTCAGSRLTGSATRPTTRVPAGCAPADVTRPITSSASASPVITPSFVVLNRIVASSGILPDRERGQGSPRHGHRGEKFSVNPWRAAARLKAQKEDKTMTMFKTFAAALSAVFVTLVTVGTLPAFAANVGDAQAPRASVNARTDDLQAPRGELRASTDDAQAPRGDFRASTDDAQAPRGDLHARTDDLQAPRGQDAQAPATQDDAQAPRGLQS